MVVVVVVVVEEDAVTGVVNGREVWGGEVISFSVVGDRVGPEEKDSVSSSGVVVAACVEVTVVEAAVGGIGTEVGAEWVVMVIVVVGLVVEASVAWFGASVLK